MFSKSSAGLSSRKFLRKALSRPLSLRKDYEIAAGEGWGEGKSMALTQPSPAVSLPTF
jgi:hypothetical protein